MVLSSRPIMSPAFCICLCPTLRTCQNGRMGHPASWHQYYKVATEHNNTENELTYPWKHLSTPSEHLLGQPLQYSWTSNQNFVHQLMFTPSQWQAPSQIWLRIWIIIRTSHGFAKIWICSVKSHPIPNGDRNMNFMSFLQRPTRLHLSTETQKLRKSQPQIFHLVPKVSISPLRFNEVNCWKNDPPCMSRLDFSGLTEDVLKTPRLLRANETLLIRSPYPWIVQEPK